MKIVGPLSENNISDSGFLYQIHRQNSTGFPVGLFKSIIIFNKFILGNHKS
jgi:hypothetical protein